MKQNSKIDLIKPLRDGGTKTEELCREWEKMMK